MSEWDRAAKESGSDFKRAGKLIKGYSYQTRKKAAETDEKVRKALAENLDKAKSAVFNVMEEAYRESRIEKAEGLKRVMEWIDVIILELKVELIFDEDATSKEYKNLVRHDLELLDDSAAFAKTVAGMEKNPASMIKRSGTIRKYVVDLLKLYKRRRHSLEA